MEHCHSKEVPPLLRGGAEGGHSAESEAVPCETEGVDENDSKKKNHRKKKKPEKQHHLPHSSAMTDVYSIFRLTPNIALNPVMPSNGEIVGQEARHAVAFLI